MNDKQKKFDKLKYYNKKATTLLLYNIKLEEIKNKQNKDKLNIDRQLNINLQNTAKSLAINTLSNSYTSEQNKNNLFLRTLKANKITSLKPSISKLNNSLKLFSPVNMVEKTYTLEHCPHSIIAKRRNNLKLLKQVVMLIATHKQQDKISLDLLLKMYSNKTYSKPRKNKSKTHSRLYEYYLKEENLNLLRHCEEDHDMATQRRYK